MQIPGPCQRADKMVKHKIGALGAVAKNLEMSSGEVKVRGKIETIKLTAPQKSEIIKKRFQEIWGECSLWLQ